MAKTPQIVAKTPTEIAKLFCQHADHDKARDLANGMISVLSTANQSHATNAVAFANALSFFIQVMPDCGVDDETLEAIVALAHAILTLNPRKDIPKVN